MIFRSRREKEDAIAWVIQHGDGVTASQIMDITGVWSGTLYPVLVRLEREKKISRIQTPLRFYYYPAEVTTYDQAST